jgi:hypothetical protein
MPKKTKKQKILAKMRQQQLQKTALPGQSALNNDLNYSFKPIIINHSKDFSNKENSNIEATYFIVRDLRKTITLSILAVLFELVLYWLKR